MSSKTKSPMVVITLINWNGLEDTVKCLESLKAIEYGNFEVVVVDNASRNDEANRIAGLYPEIRVIKNSENLGFTGACNQGIDVALANSAKYVLLLNNDTIVTKDFLSVLVRFYESEPNAGIISPLILYTDKKRIWFAGAKVFLGMIRHTHKGRPIKDVKIPKQPFITDYVPGTSLLISTGLIDKIGKLNDRYFAYYEDLEWSYLAKKVGYYPYVVPDAVIYHKKSGSTSAGGHARFSRIPAYFLARNGIFLASNFTGLKKYVFLLNQIMVKLPLTLILLIKLNAWSAYMVGVAHGFGMLARPNYNPRLSK